MKQCSYCGAEYPDDAIECAIDKTPFGQIHFAEGTKAAVTVRHKIPMSLSMVTCYLIANGIFQIGWSILLGQYIGNVPVLNIIYGVLVLFIASGLRRCSRSWRICALVVIWVGFIGPAWTVYDLVLRYFLIAAHKPINEHPVGFYITQTPQIPVLVLVTSLVVHLSVQIWQYRVLTRPEVRDLFYNEP